MDPRKSDKTEWEKDGNSLEGKTHVLLGPVAGGEVARGE
jgi:hypothetical protein